MDQISGQTGKIWVTSQLSKALRPTAIALGNFDGLHRGHQRVMQPMVDWCRANAGVVPTLVTFNPHPREYFSGESYQLLTPVREKAQILSALGIRQLIRLPFTAALAALTPQAFIETILYEQLQVHHISVGADFRFGVNQTGDASTLHQVAERLGIEVTIAALFRGDLDLPERISSTQIRQAIANHELPLVEQMLGRPYHLAGEVMTGQQLGRKLGFPTANLSLPTEKLLPPLGVYAVKVNIEHGSDSCPGVLNLGHRPTVEGLALTAEVHLLDWQGDLYGQYLTVSLEKYLRAEQKFDSLDALKRQIYQDCQTAKQVLSLH
ncbi:MAG: bifunctional riboflavin kinase/FAD synthetase [Cyanobacteria bacterium P01_H01_bin.15]